MNSETFHRLHNLRMENDAAKFAMDDMRPRFDQMKNRKENGTAPRAIVAYQLFQTPKAIASRLVSMLNLKPGARVLEPSAGLGRLLDALGPCKPSEIVAVELTQQCAGELFKQDRSGVVIKQRDFLTMTTDDLGTFDAVVMNPPFHMRSDIRHIEHALKFLKPGGRLATICLDTHHRREAFEEMAEMWVDLNAGEFRESGTMVSTALIVIQK